MEEARHVSVLLEECIENLNIRPGGIYLDGTLGLGGHSMRIAERLTTAVLSALTGMRPPSSGPAAALPPLGRR